MSGQRRVKINDMIDGLASYKKRPPSASKEYQESYECVFDNKKLTGEVKKDVDLHGK